MNVVQVTSGLGNQMFQYAFGRAVGASYDVSWFEQPCGPTSVPRKFELPLFDCALPLIGHDKVRRMIRRPKLLRLLGIRPELGTVREPSPSVFTPEYLAMKNTNFVGYYQCERYFLPLRRELLAAFRLKDPPRDFLARQAEIRGQNAVAVHIRRGDYVQHQDVFGLCGVDYYRAAMRYVRERVKDPVFHFFSDDMFWTREAFSGDRDCVFADGAWDSAACDLMLMASCRHNIVANSTYSWWGAWLNDTAGKIVIAPKRWLVSDEPNDIVPEDWVRL